MAFDANTPIRQAHPGFRDPMALFIEEMAKPEHRLNQPLSGSVSPISDEEAEGWVDQQRDHRDWGTW